ncbi:DUF4124 domain-containing protein [Marinimicrobium alkaliphilum]|uniref:DUF4124 domain-containing protein n=1 Tax=Marinimicrobium alkaliphilum TaxID=2202654 RepID=UPI000DB972DC|nr:DUF4124 domain-containing protein [Marinimicrobium alkaliphilum]
MTRVLHMNKALLIGAALAALAILPAQAGEIYRWVDDSGVTHFTSQPPPGRESTRIRTRTGQSEPVQRPAQSDPRERSEPITPRVEAQEQERDRERCRIAQQNLERLMSGARIQLEDADGQRRFIDDDERQERATQAQQVIEEHC